MALRVESLSVGLLQTKCYLVWDSASKHGVVIDPGDEGDLIAETIAKLGFTPVDILLTHGHFDHIRAAGDLARRFDVKIRLHRDDHALYASPDNGFPPWLPAPENLPPPVDLGETVGKFHFTVLHTPGHSPGCVCFHLPHDNIVFSGDTLMLNTVGRTDFPGGDADRLAQSIRAKLYTLPEETKVYPGHGPPTRIGTEKQSNPFVQPLS